MIRARVITLCTAALLLLGAGSFVWPAGGTETTGSAVAGDLNVTGPGVLPVVRDKVTLTVAMPQNPNVKDFDTNDQTQWYRDQTNLEFSFELLPQKDAKQKMQIMIASGGDLPDVLINLGFTNTEVLRYGSQKAFIELSEFIDRYGFWFNNALELNEDKNLRGLITSADGNIYGLPRYIQSTPNEWSGRAWIYKPWLDKLGLQAPKTTDEFYKVLKAFKTMDPNGNGKADEIPYAGSTNGWRQQPYDFIFNAFIYNNLPDYFLLEGDKLEVAYIKNEWREALRYMAKLSKEDLLSPLSFTQDQAQLRQMVEMPDINVLGAFMAGNITSVFSATNPRMLEVVSIPVLEGPAGVAWSTFYPSMPVNAFHITKSCENPEAAFRWGDFMFSEEASYRHRFGVPGRDWVEASPSELSMFGDKASMKPILVWGTVQNAHWTETTAGYRPYKITDGQVWDGNPYNAQYINVQSTKNFYMNRAPSKVVYPFNLTLEESDEISEVKNTINSYVKESIARFVTGDLNIETDWESYLKELEKMGLERYLEISRKAYERMIKG